MRQLPGDHVAAPIAIIGMACRYPGDIVSPEDLWEFVAAERCAVAEMPQDRGWDLGRLFHPDETLPGRSSSRYCGGVVADAAMFDADFFGISPRDAVAMNPVQRLLLMTAWEAFEHAGIVPDAVRGQDVGTFVGIHSPEYGPLWHESAADVEGKLMTGTMHSAASGRLSHFFGLSGPCITVDTGCSASLVGVHLAMQSLRSGESSMALVGGASFQATPGQFTEFTRQGGLASDGKCKAFAESADGAAWSEGVGLLLLARLSDAQRAGRRVLGVVRGSAVNHDGDGNRFTVPNSGAHERLIRRALADAGLAVHEVDAVDAHGTGTSVGDPIEAEAILATYGQRPASDRPLLLGSLKSNLGHTTAAAGVGSVIKMVQAMRQDVLPRTLHVDKPNSRIDWSSGSVQLLEEAAPWPRGERPRRAAVSSFGIGGTNAHVVLEEAPPAEELAPVRTADRGDAAIVPWVLSGRTEEALRDQALALRRHVAAHPGLDLVDVGFSLATSRARFEHRAVVIASDLERFTTGLNAIAEGRPAESVVAGRTKTSGGTAFVFPGQGAQWPGMARELAKASPVFADCLDECAQALAPYCDWELLDVLNGAPGAASLDRVDVVQPALFAMMVSLARMWAHYGVQPTCVVGHSQGEIAAACVAGALSLDDAAKVVALRSKAIRNLTGDCAMASFAMTPEQVRPHLAEGVSIAVVNGPSATVLAGPRLVLEELVADLTAKDERARMLPVDYASHSAQVEQIREELLAELAGIAPRTSAVPFYSTVTGQLFDTAALTAEYWYTNLRQTVRFADAVRTVLGDGVLHFVEASPHPLLLAAIEEVAAEAGAPEAATVGSLRRGEAGTDSAVQHVMRYVSQAFVDGLPIDGEALFAGLDARRVDLPTYAFQTQRFWLGNASATASSALHGFGSTGHPLLGATVELADDSVLLSGTLSTRTHPWLADHGVHGSVIVPGAALVEMVVRAADEVGCGFLEELVLAAPLVLPGQDAVAVQVVIGGQDDTGRRKASVRSRLAAGDRSTVGGSWTSHATGSVLPAGQDEQDGAEAWPPTGADPIDVEAFHHQLAAAGYFYGEAFRGLRAAWRRGTEMFAEAALTEPVRADAGRFILHPALLDAALLPAAVDSAASGQTRVPFTFNRVRLHSAGASALRVRLAFHGDEVAITATDPAGQPVLSIEAVTTRPLSLDQLSAGRLSTADSLLRVQWSAVAAPPGAGGPILDITVRRCEETDPRRAAAWALAAVQWLLREDSTGSAMLALVTHNAVVCDPGDEVNAAQAAVWGLVRTARAEHGSRFVLVDVDDRDTSDASLSSALALGETELAIRGDIVSVPRLVRAADPRRMILPAAPSWHVTATEVGTLTSLAAVPDESASTPLEAGQVRIAARAIGLNFKDVLIALGMVPGSSTTGLEGAGVVVEVAPGESGLKVGDRVLGYWPDRAGSVVIADRRLVARIPAGWSFAQAASVPVAYMTALHGLRDVGGVRPGERVLVHAAAGGVGVAAVHVAKWLGAEVFGTASPGKWPVLRGLGLDDHHIASSRTAEFADRFGTVDVVLNSLTGELLDASLQLLDSNGRFVEMGKTDLRDPTALDVAYRPFDLTAMDADVLGRLLSDVLSLFETGELTELPPLRAWDVREAREAMSFMRQGKHVGKNVLTLPRALEPAGTVLITGGTGKLGRLLARHLVAEHGVRELVLTGRRGPDTPGSTELVAELAELGAHARVVACDVAERPQAEALVAGIGSGLTGIVHAAGTLDDGTVESLTPERFEAVFRPKADAASHLDELTRHLDLAMFVLFSSMAGTLGSPGQANYAAANTAMDAIAVRRQAAGLPGQSLAWGFWQSASGMTAHLADLDRERLARSGMRPMPDELGLALFDAARSDGGAVLATAAMNVEISGSGASPLVRGLAAPARRVAAGSPSTTSDRSLPSRLAGMAAPERTAALVAIVRAHAAAVLGHSGPEAIGRDRAFKELGIDSLTAVELRNKLTSQTGVRLAPTVVFQYPNPAELAEHLATLLGPSAENGDGASPEAVSAAAAPDTAEVVSAEQIDEMDITALVAMVNPGSTEVERERR
ncbi:type I polyketide synthase [Streptomyces sp. NBC_00433]